MEWAGSCKDTGQDGLSGAYGEFQEDVYKRQALCSLLIGIIICISLISMLDRYRINLNYKYENMTVRYDIPENGSLTATYSSDQTQYAIFDSRGNKICTFNVDYQKERPVQMCIRDRLKRKEVFLYERIVREDGIY